MHYMYCTIHCKQGIHGDPVLVELVAVLKTLACWLKNGSPYKLKTRGKMLRNAHVSGRLLLIDYCNGLSLLLLLGY